VISVISVVSMSRDPARADSAMKLGRLALARGTVDRAAERRTDARWLAQAWADPRTRVFAVEDGRALVRYPAETAGHAELVLVSPADAGSGARILLGVDSDGVAYFAVMGPGAAPDEDRPGEARPDERRPGVARAGLRQAGALLGDRDAGLLTHAVALANWHGTHEHCPRCGARTKLTSAGHSRTCPADGSEHFPRIDPAVIMLVLDPAGRCLLARNNRWPKKRVSILAGFVEPGESAEQAVAREVAEEVGIAVGEFRYLGSQPWPLPQSLMLGFSARVVDGRAGARPGAEANRRTGVVPLRVDDAEIAEARWYSRDDLRAAVSAGEILLPSEVSIAHRIIESWYGGPLPKAR